MEIPEIDEERSKELYRLLKPIVTIGEMKYLLREFVLTELWAKSYVWNAEGNKRDIVDPNKLETIDDFLCLHRYGYYGLFKPSIAEVFLQAPENVIKEANTFEIIESPQTSEDLYKYEEVFNKEFHLSKVRSYKLHK